MMILKMFKKKWVKIVAVVLAVVTVLGAVAGLASLLNRKHIKPGEINGDPDAAKVPEYGLRGSDYALLYVQDGLEACYTAYSAETLTSSTNEEGELVYSWTNHVNGGAPATLEGGKWWHVTKGGIGYTMTYDQWLTDSSKVGCILPFDPEGDLMETDEFLYYNPIRDETGYGYDIEVVLAYDGVKNVDGSHYYSTDPLYNGAKSAFRFGILSGTSFVGTSDAGAENLATRWYLSNKSFSKHYGKESDSVVSFAHFLGFDLIPRKENSEVVRMNVTFFASGNASTSISYGNSPYSSDCYREKILDLDTYLALCNSDIADAAPRFSLLNGFPGRLYSVRVYQGKELTQDEEARNYFVDLLAFYDVNVQEILRLSVDEQNTFLVKCGNRAIARKLSMDVSQYDAMRTELSKIINTYMP